MFSLTDKEIIPGAQIDNLKSEFPAHQAGALVTFEGWVRDHNEGKKVSALDYQVYNELAQKEGEKILDEAITKFNLTGVSCVHRYGSLNLGDCAVWVGANAAHRQDAFSAARYVIDEIKTRLPIWKKEHYVDAPAVWVSCQSHQHHVHFEESDYYLKQKQIIDQEKLKIARVAVVGAGGLGCPALQSLAMAGVGHLTVIDFDRVDISNLHRQPLYSTSQVGERKSAVAARKLIEMNPFIEVRGINARVNFQNALKILKGFDLVLDCTDMVSAKYLLHDACFTLKIPLVSAGIYKQQGQLRTFDPESNYGCLYCLSPEALLKNPDDALVGNCNDFGVLGATAAVLGSLQASEALQFLDNHKNASLKETLCMDLNDINISKIKNKKRKACPCCDGNVTDFQRSREAFNQENGFEISMNDLAPGFEVEYELIDVRDKDDSFLEDYCHSHKKVIVYCHRGIRSRQLVQNFRERGFSHFYSLAGGACSL